MPVTAQIAGATENQLPFKAINVAATTPIDGRMPTIIQVVYLDCREALSLPKPGHPLFVGSALTHHDGNLYRGVPLPAPADDGHFVGFVWHSQPVQRLAHRNIASIAVCVAGSIAIHDQDVLDKLKGPPGTATRLWDRTMVKISDDDLVYLLQ